MSTSNTSKPPVNRGHAVSLRLYRLLLLAYPSEFRREYGPYMAQLFRDCCRDDTRDSRERLWHLWLRTLLDLVQTAPKEHLDNLRKENSVMKHLRNDALALFGCIAILVGAFALLTYGRNHGVASIMLFGYALDALVATGVIGNFIVFLLVKTTRLNSLRIAFWTFLAIHTAFLLTCIILGTRLGPPIALGAVVIGYVVSFLFWFGLHWMWAKSTRQLAVSSGDNP